MQRASPAGLAGFVPAPIIVGPAPSYSGSRTSPATTPVRYSRQSKLALAPGDAHMARQRRALVAAVDHEVMAFGLAGDRLIDGVVEQVVALRGTQHAAQVGGIVLAEAHEQRARAGDAHAVAGFAEIVRQRRDEAEPAAGLAHAHVAGRPAGAVIDLVEGEAVGEPGSHHRQRQVLLEPVLADIAER